MKSRQEIEHALCLEVSQKLQKAVDTRRRASLAVSGGSTPMALFQLLSESDIEWKKVDILPVDERILADGNPDQNGTLIKKVLLQNKAAAANFIPLVYDAENATKNLLEAKKAIKAIQFPISVCILGMGTDGHTASLFPCSTEIGNGLSENNQDILLNVNPKTAPYKRISLTANTIKASKHIYLHIYGNEKQEVIEKAKSIAKPEELPISAFLNLDNIKIYWTN